MCESAVQADKAAVHCTGTMTRCRARGVCITVYAAVTSSRHILRCGESEVASVDGGQADELGKRWCQGG